MDATAYPLEILYDGQCAICRFDVANLARHDRHGRLVFVDVTTPGFDPSPYGRSREQLLARISARRADGRVVDGPEVFRLALTANGLGLLVAPTRWPGLAWITEHAYGWFARNRSRLSRRFGGVFARLTPDCDADGCRVPHR